MVNQFGNMLGQFQMMQKLTKDENLRTFMNNPKVREVFMDLEFKELMQKNDLTKLVTHPQFASLLSDPEIAGLIELGTSKIFV